MIISVSRYDLCMQTFDPKHCTPNTTWPNIVSKYVLYNIYHLYLDVFGFKNNSMSSFSNSAQNTVLLHANAKLLG